MNRQADSKILNFIENIKLALDAGDFIKIKLSKPVKKNQELKEVSVRLVEIKKNIKLLFVYRYKTKDITKNLEFKRGLIELTKLLSNDFKNCLLFTTANDIRLSHNKKMEPSLVYGPPSFINHTTKSHDREKKRFIKIEENLYLKELGVINKNFKIAPDMGAKYKQINKFIETLDGTIKNSDLLKAKNIKVVDMGCGKGYLTFAVYDHLSKNLKLEPSVTGVEIKKDLVEFCNQVAKKSNFKNLKFYESTIENYPLESTDILIALHACDTATDDAIYQGIRSNCSIMILSPCCHKQIRKEIKIKNELHDLLKYGILKERIAEIITDTMRGLVLETHGYKTQILEFISDEYTHKNLVIIGVKKKNNKINSGGFRKIDNLKKMFGIEEFYLEKILKVKKNKKTS